MTDSAKTRLVVSALIFFAAASIVWTLEPHTGSMLDLRICGALLVAFQAGEIWGARKK